MANDLEVMSYDLRLYLKGFEVALGRNDVKEAVDYLNKIREEAKQNLEFLTETYGVRTEQR